MGLLDWIGPTSLTKRRGWDALPAPAIEQKSAARSITLFDSQIGFMPTSWSSGRAPLSTSAASCNSAVFACLQAIASALAEPELKVYRLAPGERVELERTPLGELLHRPNPRFSMDTLLGYLSTSLHVDGNAYWRKLRAGNPETGNVVELWPVAPSAIEPVTLDGGTDFIDYYRYQAAGTGSRQLSPRNVVHFRYGLDDQDHRLGLSPLKRLLREVSSDEQATRYADRLLANLAINGLTLSFDKESAIMTQEQADAAKARIREAFGGDNVGDAAVLSPGATLTALGFSPEQMDLRVLHQVPEERISAVLGVPAAIVGLGAGLEHSIYNNVKQAEEHFTERKLIPLWRSIAADLTLQLLPDFASDPAIVVDFDTDDVRALADDQGAEATRLKTLVDAGILSADEARAELGYAPGAPEPKPAPPVVVPAAPVAAARRLLSAEAIVSGLGPPLPLGEGDLDRLARVRPDDLGAAERFWREAVDGTGLEDLLDARSHEEG